MATATASPESVRLTEAFRATETTRAAAVAAAVALWFKYRVNADDPATIERWLAILVPKIIAEINASAARATVFGNTIRTLETGRLDNFRFEPVTLENLEERVRTSLVVTGPVDLHKRLEKISGQDLSPAVEKALIQEAVTQSAAGAGAAAARHVQNGGRETLRDGVARDAVALGYVRVTKPSPCYFCAMLASRGAVYQGDSFKDSDPLFDGPGHVKVHDSCGCSLKPLYRRNDEILDRSLEWSDLWGVSTKGKSGMAAVRAFRQAYEGREIR